MLGLGDSAAEAIIFVTSIRSNLHGALNLVRQRQRVPSFHTQRFAIFGKGTTMMIEIHDAPLPFSLCEL